MKIAARSAIVLTLMLLQGARDSRAATALERPALTTRYFEIYPRGTTLSAHTALVARVDQDAERVAKELRVTFPKTHLVIAGTTADWNASLPSGVVLPDSALGVAFQEDALIVLRNAPAIATTFVHEASHIALLTATHPRRPPRWFIEGYAAYQAGESTLTRMATLSRASVAGELIPLRALEAHFPAAEGATELAYAQSNEMIAYLLGTYGTARLRELTTRIARGEPFFAALERAYGQSLNDLEAAYVQDLRVRYNWVPIVTGSVTLYLGITFVLLVAIWRKRRRMKRRLAEMAREESAEDAEWDALLGARPVSPSPPPAGDPPAYEPPKGPTLH